MHIPQITFTRFLASIAIVFFHFGWNSFPLNTSLGNFGEELVSAMTYFFLLSGFILVISVSKDGIILERINKMFFWKRRAARILPMYFLAMLLFFILNFEYSTDESLREQTQGYLFAVILIQAWLSDFVMDINYPSWSLSVEAFFYFLFPWILILWRKFSSKTIIVLSVILWIGNLFLYIYLNDNNFQENFIKFYPPLHLATFIQGVGTGILLIRHFDWIKEKASKYIHTATILMTILVIYTSYNNYSFYEYQHNGLLSPFFLVLLLSLSILDGKLKEILSSKPLIFLGGVSYAIYILQVPIYQLCQKYIPILNEMDEGSLFYPYLIVLFLVSSICFVYFEKPMRKWILRKKKV